MPSDVQKKCSTCGALLSADGTCPSCDGSSTKTDTTLFPNLEGYRFVRILGEGAMGTVLLAEDVQLKRLVAIKMMSSRFLEDPLFAQRFLREARSMAALEFPHIVRIYSYGTSEGGPYLVMEFIEGETLAEKIQREGALKLDEALRITMETAEALNAAWQKNVIHRDIKPSNILIAQNHSVKIADFGLAKVMLSEDSSDLTKTGAIMGTPHYIAPEQAVQGNGDFRSDIYSLGLVLFEMVTGTKPFTGATPLAVILKQVNEPLPSPNEFRHDVNEQVTSLIESMTKKSPTERPNSYEKLLSEIRRVKDLRRSSVFARNWKWAVGVLLIALIITVVIHRTQQRPVPEVRLPQAATNHVIPVFVNVLPWAKVRIIDPTMNAQVAEAITPATLSLKEGKYTIEIHGPSSDIIRQDLSVAHNGTNRFVIMLPGYDPAKGLKAIQSQ